ncbi:MAG: alanine racemase, partial [Thermomicrobiales bacterium]
MTATFTVDRPIVDPGQVLDTPVMVVDEAILHQNIAEMQAFAKSVGVNLRPHIKTHKTPQIARLQLQAGAIGVTCAKLGEAEVMAHEAGVKDILIAYPQVGQPKLDRLLKLMDHAHMTIAVDTLAAAEGLSQAVTAVGRTLDLYLEVNTGQDRAGARAGEEAIALGAQIARLPGVRIVGVMTHEGHAGASEPDVIASKARAAGQALVETAEALRAVGIPVTTVSVGSTPSSPYTPTIPGVTEMRPGTYVFNDNTGFRHGRMGPDR